MQVDLQVVLNWFAYWVLFWTIVNIILPPREIFDVTPSWYNTLLKVVAYYGSLNLRQFSVRLYSAVNQQTDPVKTSLERAQTAAKEAVTATKDASVAVEVAKDAVVTAKKDD